MQMRTSKTNEPTWAVYGYFKTLFSYIISYVNKNTACLINTFQTDTPIVLSQENWTAQQKIYHGLNGNCKLW